jgi:hypothetical protein
MTTFLSSGFQPAITARTRTHPATDSIRKIAAGLAAGQVVVTLVKVPNAVSYELRWSAITADGSPGEWVYRPIANTRPLTVSGLTPGTAYAFQTRALTRSGSLTGWGESVTRICT